MAQRSEPPANDFYLDENKNELLYESLLKYISILLGQLTKSSQQKKKKKKSVTRIMDSFSKNDT